MGCHTRTCGDPRRKCTEGPATMTIRPKTIRRLLLLASVSGASAAIIGGAFAVRRHARENDLAEQRQLGMAAFEAGDLARAMPPLALYVSARPDDVDAIYALACTHLANETPGKDNLFDARSRLQQVLARRPDHLPAKRQLLVIYERTHLPRELLATADEVLAAAPGDAPAARARAIALAGLNREAESITAWESYLAISPTDFRAQAQLLAAMKRAGRPADELVAYARANVERWPDDARFQLPLAAALREAGQDREAQSLLESLAARPQSDALFVVELAAALDRTRAFDAAEQLLARSAKTLGSSTLSTALIERMWQNGRHDQVIAATENAATTAGKRDADALAMRALSLAATGRRDDAAKVAAELATLKGDDKATAWSLALGIEFAGVRPTPQVQVRTLREALGHDPDNGILMNWLGRAFKLAGEPEQSARCLREAAQRLPSWPTPCIELADAMLEAGRTSDAVSAAKAAYSRAPSSLAVQLQVARVRFAELRDTKASEDDVNELLARIDRLMKQIGPEPSLAAMSITLHSTRDDDKAVADRTLKLLASMPKGANLQPLYEAIVRVNPATASTVFDRASSDGTITPSLAIVHAGLLASEKSRTDAIAWIETQTATHHGDAAWRLAEARVRTTLGDPTATDLWNALAESFPSDPFVQSAALAEGGELIGDRTRQAALVERLKIIVGEDASPYRIARARWLAASNDDAEVRQALTMAADLVRQQSSRAELRVLLARVLVRLDSATTAIDHLRAAHVGAPSDVAIAIEFSDVLRRAGRASEGVTVLKDQAKREIEDGGTRAALGRALFEAGAFNEAAALAKRSTAKGNASSDDRLLAAAALEATGDLAAAADAYAAAAGDDRATPAAIAAAATFERRQGRSDRAAALMVRIAQSDAPAEARVRAAADYALAFGETDAARELYASQLDSGQPSVDLMLDAINLEMAQRDLEKASALVAAASARFTDDRRVARAGLELAVLRARSNATDDGKAMDALIESLAADPTTRRQAVALRALRESKQAGRPTPELASRLAALADADPASIELARQAIAAAFATNQPQLAGDLARRLLATAGARVDAVSLATQALFELRDYPASRRAAERWRAMTANVSTSADIILARIALAEGVPARALKSIEPHRAEIAWDRDPSLPATLAEALAANGREKEAFDLLEPALETAPAARTAWLSIAARSRDVDGMTTRFARLELATPNDATDERVRLAGACLELSQIAPAPEALEQGIELLKPLEAAGRLTASARSLLAELQRTSGDVASAETTLRDALLAEPENAMVKNSLAYLLLSKPGNAAEAVRLASEAVTTAPRQAAFRDTLARALIGADEPAKAEAAFREALRIDDGLLDAWVGLARLQAKLGRTADAVACVQRVDDSLAKRSTHEPPIHLREELRTVRQSVATVRE